MVQITKEEFHAELSLWKLCRYECIPVGDYRQESRWFTEAGRCVASLVEDTFVGDLTFYRGDCNEPEFHFSTADPP